MKRVLVTFATKTGSTKEIASAIGVRLTERGCLADVRPVETVGSVDGYDAVVLGSAVYARRWRPEAARFYRQHVQAMAARKVWLFESGWVGDRSAEVLASPGARWRAKRVGAPEPGVFVGRPSPGVRNPTDVPDWDEVASWADELVDTLVTEAERKAPA